jgi:hypothetical protein
MSAKLLQSGKTQMDLDRKLKTALDESRLLIGKRRLVTAHTHIGNRGEYVVFALWLFLALNLRYRLDN